jgi:hypothetical protein
MKLMILMAKLLRNIKFWFIGKTVSFRHRIVSLIAPHLYLSFIQTAKVTCIVPRPTIQFIKKNFNDHNLVGAEIGVLEADNAINILQELHIEKLFLIDPYEHWIGEKNRKKAEQRLSKYPQAIFIKKTSDDAAHDFKEPLDFVYVDGDHSYEQVKRDLEHYYTLVKFGGVLGGHDYPLKEGVKIAVDEFAKKIGATLHISFPDWWIVKSER